MIRSKRFGDVCRRSFCSEPRRFASRRRSADAIRENQHCSEARPAKRQSIGICEARAVNDYLRMYSGYQELVLIVAAHFSLVRDAEHIEVFVPGTGRL